MNTIKRRLGFLGLLAFLGAGCSDAGVVGESGAAQFSLDPQGLTLAIGETATITPASKSNGRTVNPRSLKWVSTNASAATVTSDGVVRGMGLGQAMVVASSGNLADTTRVTVVAPGPRLEISPDSLILGSIGAKQKMGAVIRDGATVTPTQVTWRSLNSDVIQIDSMGNATARAFGATMIIATSVCCGQADTAHARVQQLASNVIVEPSIATVPMGGTIQLLTTVTDGTSGVMASSTVTWASDNQSIARVSTTGLVTPVAPGTAVIRATSGGTSGTSSVTVTPAVATTPGEIPLSLHRLVPGTGPVRVSTGILLQPGQLRDGGIGTVAVLVGSTEVSAYVEALQGRHKDGSLVSVLVQFDADPATQKNATLKLGTTPSRPRLAKQAVDFRPGATISNVTAAGYPAAVALPPTAHMASAFRIFGPTVTSAEASAMGGAYAAFESDFASWSTTRWDSYQRNVSSQGVDAVIMANYYDRGLHHLAWLHRTGDPRYFQRGAAYVFNNRFHYYERNNYASQPHLWMPEGLVAHYWLTGDEESRRGVRELARQAYGTGSSPWWTRWRYSDYPGESRPVARTISVISWTHRLGYTDLDWAAVARQAVDKLLQAETHITSSSDYRYGAWAFRHPDYDPTVTYVSNFMQAMVLDALITLHDQIHADARIPGMVQRTLDYLRKSQYRANDVAPSFNYYDVGVKGSGGPDASVDLNGFYVHVFAWYGRHSGRAEYMDIADQLFRTLSANPKDGKVAPWLSGDKQFNETYAKAWQYAGYRR
jgi:uncharacterized protein YjdB